MKTLHVNLKVEDINRSVDFYSKLFNAEPSVVKPDYAKWLMTDPQVNFSLSLGNKKFGVAHLGIQVDSPEELQEVYSNIEKAEGDTYDEGHTVCCYSKSEKSWIADPQGVEWEAFHTYGESETFKEEAACCDDNCCTS